MTENVRKELDHLVEVIDNKIESRIDARELDMKKSNIGIGSKKSFEDIIMKSLKENKGNKAGFEIKAGELFVSEVTGNPVQPSYVPNIKNTPFANDLRQFLNSSKTTSDSVVVNRAVYNANNTANTSEGASYPTSTNLMTAVTFNVKKFAHKFASSCGMR